MALGDMRIERAICPRLLTCSILNLLETIGLGLDACVHSLLLGVIAESLTAELSVAGSLPGPLAVI